jgi:UDP-N-acetylglucosamine acyltransferase
MSIHKTAVIADGAQIDPTVEIGPYAVIGPEVKIGSGTKIGAHAVIDGITTIGKDCKIYAGAAIGLDPQDLSYKDEATGVIIGDRVTVREYATIHKAVKEGFTIVGDDCFLMNFAHVAHNCVIGKGVIMANAATLGGYVHVGDGTVMAGLVAMHQHVRIGRYCMISGVGGTRKDLPPFAMCDGRPCRIRGINILGLRRAKFKPELRTAIKNAYRMIYMSDENISQSLERIEREIEQFPEIVEILDFFRTTKRGVVGKTVEDEEESGDFESAKTGKQDKQDSDPAFV